MTRTRVGWLLVVLQFVLLTVLVVLPWRPPTPLSLLIGVPVAGAGIVLGLVASRRLGRALTPTPVPIEGAGLRTEGVYSWVRHPIYSAVLLLALGFVIAVGSWWSAGCAVVLVLFFLAKSRWEDGLLAAEYGQEWRDWASRTGALIPHFPRQPQGRRGQSSSTSP